MKRTWCLILALVFLALTGCTAADRTAGAQRAGTGYGSYTEIPGVTQEEIDAIEALLRERPTLIYGASETTETFYREDGTIGGFSALFTDRMSELFGFQFVIRPVAWNDLIEGIVSTEIDFTGEFTATPERLNIYYMTDPIVQRTIKIFCDGTRAPLSDTAKERAIRCAFLDGSTMYDVVKDIWELPFEPVFLDDEHLVPDLLASGEIDAFIEEEVFEAFFDAHDFIRAEDFYPLTYSPVSLTTGNEALRPIISVMQKYLQSGGYYDLTELYNLGYRDYAIRKLFGKLTEEEKEYIRQHKESGAPILVAYEPDNYPTSFYNAKEKEFQGMAKDTLAHISELTGLTFAPGNAPEDLWRELIGGLESGKYAICSELLRSAQREDRFIWAEVPYRTSNYALLSKAEYPNVDINQILFSRVGLMEESGYTDVFLEWFPDSAGTATYYIGLYDAFVALERGEIDLLMANEDMLLNLTNYQEKPGYKVNVVFNYSADSYFGFNRDERVLCSIVSKALGYIDVEEVTSLWQRKVFDYRSKMLSDLLPYAILFTAALAAALVVLFIVLQKNRRINKNLDRTVSQRTAELETQALMLERRLEQQRVMADLSQNFIAGGDLDAKITESLRLTGEFLDVGRVLLLKYEDHALLYLNEWCNPTGGIQSKLGLTLPVNEAERQMVKAYSERELDHFSLDHVDREDFIRRYELDDIKNLLMLPIYVGNDFWGVLEFDQCERYAPWSPSDINLGEMVAGILSGVVARQQMEEALGHLSSIVENSPQFITTVRLGGAFAYFNPAALDISGYSREELEQGGLRLLMRDEEYRRLREEIMPIVIRNKKHTYELPFIIKSGEERVMSVSAFSLDSNVNAISSIASDITEIRRTQVALGKRLEQQSLMTSIAQSFLTVTDIDALVDNALRMVGEFMEVVQILCYKRDGNGRTFVCQNEWISPKVGLPSRIGGKMEVIGPMVPILERMLIDREFYMSSNDPTFKAAMAHYRVHFENYITTPLYLKDQLFGVLDFSKVGSDDKWSESDLTLAILVSSVLSGFFERHVMEAELIAAKELAEQGSRSKSDFLSRMSHEIRTPLNAVIGMVNIAMGTEDQARIQDCLGKADAASKHLLGVINDILDMSKIEADKFELDCRRFDFDKMLQTVTNVTKFRVEEKAQSFVVNLSDNVPKSIVGDDLRLAQVLTNLLSNAVKFTPEGGTITLNIEQTEDLGDEVTLQVEVADNGIGISEEQQERLFTSFEQADGGIARRFGGTGLGLAISKRIVELMGGKIWIDSALGKGSKFTFTMRAGKGDLSPRMDGEGFVAPQPPDGGAEMMRSGALGGKTILIAEDVEINREIMSAILEETGVSIDYAENGTAAVSMFRAAPDKYDLILMDLHMPEMDGYEATVRIRALEAAHAKEVPIVAMTADVFREDIENCLAVGMNDHIGKPIDPENLIAKLWQYLRAGDR